MMRILGIDPGSRTTGYGVVELDGQRILYIDSGCIRCGDGALPDRLDVIFRSISEIINQHRPQVASVEQVFMARNPDSALKLGQARGAAVCALKQQNLEVMEYTALQIKQSVVGRGHADKQQVQHMVKALLNLDGEPQADAADALAAAICHANADSGMTALQRGMAGAKVLR
ncbi:MAG: crossover junction endodeoxyribonuclease RuvC [Proteobacteria bacterium]|nr:crossover junction endodeoxyribonuclease RuvC [Pseudomonadota bacterium]